MDREIEDKPKVPTKKSMKAFYFEFLHDFRDYLAQYVKENVSELVIAEVPIQGQVKIFDGFSVSKVKIKNQGNVPVFLSTTGQGGYKLEPGETTSEFVTNSQVIATTISGTTTIGFIKT